MWINNVMINTPNLSKFGDLGGNSNLKHLRYAIFVGDFNHQSQVMGQQLSTFAGFRASLPNMLCFCRVPSALVAPETRRRGMKFSIFGQGASKHHSFAHPYNGYVYIMDMYI